jgi:crossover junction endodeoxyribonuclease RusA
LIVLYLPYPPSVNNYWITSGNRKFLSKRGREFKEQVAAYVIEKNVPKLGEMAVQIDIILRPRNKRLMDIDNSCKAILDSIQDAGIIDDDSQVWKLTIERGITHTGGSCVVMIEEYKEHKNDSK